MEDTIAVFEDYDIKVKTWSDVPKAVRALADKWHVTPIPEGKDIAMYNYRPQLHACYMARTRVRKMCVYTAELLRYIIWVPHPCLRVLLCDMCMCNIYIIAIDL